MTESWLLAIDGVIIVTLFAAIAQFRSPSRARLGNLTAAAALLLAVAVVVFGQTLHAAELVALALVLGSAGGWYVSSRVTMLQIPAMIALQNGAGGFAAFLVSFIQLTGPEGAASPIERVSGVLGAIVGAATFSGSMVAAAKLAGRLPQSPLRLPKDKATLAGVAAGSVFLATLAQWTTGLPLFWVLTALILCALLLGVVFAIRVGGADMPVLISFLNAGSGVAAAFCGMVIESRLLIACGAAVAASGSILTHAMCRAMNRDLAGVLLAGYRSSSTSDSGSLETEPPSAGPLAREETSPSSRGTAFEQALDALKESRSVIVVPGYGMALSQAQWETVKIAELLTKQGKKVRFAIHPVAGRMPGHMHVLLAEAEVDPDILFDLPEINTEFQETDLALVVGACDVVNPAANTAEKTPISGMPILAAFEAKHVVVCNLDERPGYSGVENALYTDPKTIMMLGDAKATLGRLLKELGECPNAGDPS